MKRTSELRELSNDHHQALKLARKAKKAAVGADDHAISEVWTEVESLFNTELEPHFQIEELHIAPVLVIQGETQLVSRLYEEHAAMRKLLSTVNGRSGANLKLFGELLEQHIRFEEREFFEVAQKTLHPDQLHAVALACEARHDKNKPASDSNS